MSNKPIDLSQFDDGFRSEQPAERGDFESVPDGKYQVAVEKAELTEAHTSGNPMLKWTLRVIAPQVREPPDVAQQRHHAQHAQVREDRPAPVRARSRQAVRTAEAPEAACST